MRNKKGQFVKGITPWNKDKKGYMGANKTSFKKGDNSIPLEIRFWGKVNKTKNCWLWIGSKNNMGYGRININGIVKLAHRVSFEITNGNIQKGMIVLHNCDIPLCVNPKHLSLGTQKDNNFDMWDKNRGVKGEKASWSKLKQKEVDTIRLLYKKGNISMRKLANDFNISYTVINHIINNKIWK